MNLFFSEVFQWWLILFLLGLTFLPLTTLIFSNFFDKGYALAKVVGLLLVSYLVWILGSIRLLPFTTTTIFEIIGLSLVINLLISYRFSLTKIILSLKKIILIEEIFFFTGLILWAWVRAHEPSIHGLEKFMDFGFINSLLRTEYFPPRDLWLTPDSINYYYFGHYVAALLTKISGLSSDITYNLVLATLFALTITAAFAIGANLYHLFTTNLSSENNEHHRLLKKRWLIVSGTMSAFLVALGGNLHTIYVFFKSYVPADQPVPFWQLPLQFNPSGYWYPNATRFIPFTIHEFPIYSFVVADLHGHVLDIPFVILGIALAIKFIYQSHTPIWHYLVFGLLIAVFLMTNVLDGPIYLLLAFLLILFKNLKSHSFTFSLEAALKYSLLIGASAVVFSLPFWIAFKPFASGIGVLCAPNFLIHLGKIGPFLFEANHCMRSPLWMLTILWGFFYLIWIGFIILLLRRKLTKFKELNRTDYLIILFGVFATILIMIPEFVYAKDIYPQHYRANTVFKFGYQAFITLGLIGGYGISR
ncbi:MAG: DUF2298 domain-containing protein, partial [Patescibacteria group bacterium]|nr:DUF2298 domain-containing protein [Patescibacteria group bacterium]